MRNNRYPISLKITETDKQNKCIELQNKQKMYKTIFKINKLANNNANLRGINLTI